MAVAGKSGIERDGREIIAAVEHGIERAGEALAQDIVINGSAGRLAKHVTQVKRRQIGDPREPCDDPFVGRRKSDRLLDALDGAGAPGQRRTGRLAVRIALRDMLRRSSPRASLSS